MKEVVAFEKRDRDGLWSQTSLSEPTFRAGRVEVWMLDLDEAADAGSEASVLSSDELARAKRFRFDRDRICFIRCRAALRGLLGECLQIPADEIGFEYLRGGKPQLASDQNSQALQFNVSHSASKALIAVGSNCQLGVDIEKIRSNVDTSSLAVRFYSLRERAGLGSLPERLCVPGFFACWTRKEAFLKATGDGLSFPLKDFSVTIHPELDPALEEILGDAEAGKQWFLADLKVADGYRAAVAVRSAYAQNR